MPSGSASVNEKQKLIPVKQPSAKFSKIEHLIVESEEQNSLLIEKTPNDSRR